MNRILELKGLDCAACAAELEELISKVEGVSGASVDFVGQKARFFCESEEALSRVIGCCNGFEDVKVVSVISKGCGVRAARRWARCIWAKTCPPIGTTGISIPTRQPSFALCGGCSRARL